MESQKIIFTATPGETLKNMLENFSFDTLFILCDTHTQKFALPDLDLLFPINQIFILFF